MNHYYCKYGQSKVVKVDWDFMDADIGRYEINNTHIEEIRAIQVAFEGHLKSIKELGKDLPCFLGANADVCILKILKNDFAYLYFYDVVDVVYNERTNCWHSVLTIRKVKEEPQQSAVLELTHFFMKRF